MSLSMLLSSTRRYAYISTLNEMSHPKLGRNTFGLKREWDYKCGTGWKEGNFIGCPQGYFGHTILLFMSMKKDERQERVTYTTIVKNTLRGSILHWRSEAEKEFANKMRSLLLQV